VHVRLPLLAHVAACSADAAARSGIHWVYRQADVVAVAAGKPPLAPLEGGFPALGAENKAAWAEGAAPPAPLDLATLRPEFLSPPANPFYKYEPGELSPYGHEGLLLLRSLAKERRFDAAAYAADSAAALAAYPAAGGRLNGLSKAFLAKYEAGARPPACGVPDNSEAHSLVRVPSLVAMGAPRDVADAAMRTHQDNDLAVACGLGFAAILERAVATGAAVPALLDWAAASETVPPEARTCAAAAAAAAASGRDVRALALEFGMSCGLPGALSLALTIAGRHGDDYVAAQRANMLAGGDCASRAAVVGALAAARAGAVPDAWLSRVTLREELSAAADALVALQR
jgi:ADP-ribosylglycohydrolase